MLLFLSWYSLFLTVEPAKVKLLGTFEAIEGEEISLCCYTSSSNPPVHIRWWLGFKELNRTDVTISEVFNLTLEPKLRVWKLFYIVL